MPTAEKGGAELTRKLGKLGGSGYEYGLPTTLRHVTHRRRIERTKLLPAGIQNCDRNNTSVDLTPEWQES